MADETKEMEVQKQEIEESEGEHTRDCPCFIPRTDIYETDEGISLVANMPGVDQNTVNITLEKNVLTIQGYTDLTEFENYSLVLAEYEEGDYLRRFTLSEEIDHENIEATMRNGVLHLFLPRVGPTQRKITVSAG
jgi:HSP20 family protein